jgi:energy-coupling factor transporter transmembrane protein EcfT
LAGVLSLVLPVFAASVRRSDRFALALQARGFDPHEHYRCHPPGGLTHGDKFWVAGLLAAWVLFAVWRWRIF